MKNIKIRKLLLRVSLIALSVLLLLPSIGVSAVSEKTDEIGYDTYTYWYNFTGTTRRVVPSKPMYTVGKVYTSIELGCITGSQITDSHVSDEGLTYVLDGGASRVIVLDKNYEISYEFNYVLNTENGDRLFFNQAAGIYVDQENAVYIADKANARVIKCDTKGNLIRLYVLPTSHLIPDGFDYQPIKVAVDNKGYVYVLSNGSYYGAILYSPEDEFLGFYGSNDVALTIGQAISSLWSKLFESESAKAEQIRQLPYTFSDLWVDKQGFVYTATGTNNKGGEKAQIKRLNPGGSNILKSEEINFVDDEIGIDQVASTTRYQSLVGVAADENGFMYCIDQQYGRVYIYDSQCKLVSAFGGGLKNGAQDGTFANPTAIAYNLATQDIIVTDDGQNTVTVFNVTDYGKLVKSAQAKTVVGDYEEAMEEWSQVISTDRNCQMAYAGLARAYYAMGKVEADEKLAATYYDNALDLAKQGYDRETYALAFDSVRTEWIRNNFTWILIIAVLLIAGVIALLVYSTKHKMRVIKNEKVHLAATMLTHPFENFREIKEKGLTSVPICLVIIVLYYVFVVMETTMGGFAFTYFDPSSYNALLVLAKTVGFVLLWTISNWAVCTLFSGKGKIKEIFTVISYSLIPSLVGSVVYVVCTNVMVPDEAAFLNVLLVICSAYSTILIMAGSIIVHDYGLLKFIGTSILTSIGCGIVVFLLVAVVILLQQLGGFIGTIYTEVLKLF